jgi:hypothetical protein
MTSARPAQLFPVALDLPEWKLKDAFLWPSENTLTPHEFAAVLVKDCGLPEDAALVVAKKLTSQIERWAAVWEAKWQQLCIGAAGADTRLFVLDVDLGECVLRDRFEWDINNLANSPERFAEEMACDLGLKREHEAAVLHAVRTLLFRAWEWSLQPDAVRPNNAVTAASAVRYDPAGEWGPRLAAPATDAPAAVTGSGGLERSQRRRTTRVNFSELEDEEDDEDEEGGGDGGEEELDEEDEEENSYNDED